MHPDRPEGSEKAFQAVQEAFKQGMGGDPVTDDPHEKDKVRRRAGKKCERCGRRSKLTIDHILPKSHGGTDACANLQCLCYECNQRKADRYAVYRRSTSSVKQYYRLLALIDQANALP